MRLLASHIGPRLEKQRNAVSEAVFPGNTTSTAFLPGTLKPAAASTAHHSSTCTRSSRSSSRRATRLRPAARASGAPFEVKRGLQSLCGISPAARFVSTVCARARHVHQQLSSCSEHVPQSMCTHSSVYRFATFSSSTTSPRPSATNRCGELSARSTSSKSWKLSAPRTSRT